MGEGWVEVKPAPQGASEGTQNNHRFLHLMADPEHLGGITPHPRIKSGAGSDPPPSRGRERAGDL
jgi:hypothetical protein